MRLLCIGHSALDTIYRVAHIPRGPTNILASERIEAGGGMAANASVAAQRLGASVAYCDASATMTRARGFSRSCAAKASTCPACAASIAALRRWRRS